MLSKYKDILKIPKQIVQGLFKSIFKDPNTEKVAKYRLSVCSVCPYQGYLINISILGKQFKFIKQCKDCGCILSLKSRSLESECPQSKWFK